MITCDRSAKRHYGDEHGRYWSVSQVCEVITGGCDYYAPGAAERGEDVHLIFALAVGHSVGLCEPPDVPTEYAGYYEGIQGWIQYARPKPSGIERMMRHRTLPYAGKSDFIGLIGEEFGVLDLKTGISVRWHQVQVCAYQKMLDKAARQWILYVDKDGKFKQVSVKPSARDWAVFQNGLSILQWRES